ncbi:pentapeptide repeat-containing protein [Bernardetia sp. OM2101]|uniref:pentapeptide repeat-containing protein n=1 Tax=Bernardetia sp. OM2101 TaxID=3344876 RepID=UPI0035CF2561
MYFNKKENFETYLVEKKELQVVDLFLENLKLTNLDLYGVSTKTIIKNCEFTNCDLQGLEISDSIISSSKFLNCNFYKVIFSSSTINKTVFDNCDLTRACFTNSILNTCIISNCTLRSTEFPEIVLKNVNFDKNKEVKIYKPNWVIKDCFINSQNLVDNFPTDEWYLS